MLRFPDRTAGLIAGVTLACLALVSVHAAQTRGSTAPATRDEVRALWVVRTSLTSPSAIDEMVAAAKAGGFNTLLVPVRGRGDAYYLGGAEPRPTALAYETDNAAFASQIAAAREAAGRHPLWAGIGADRLSHEQIMDDILTVRRAGAGGVVLFSYDSLVAPARGSGYLSQLGKAAFSTQF